MSVPRLTEKVKVLQCTMQINVLDMWKNVAINFFYHFEMTEKKSEFEK